MISRNAAQQLRCSVSKFAGCISEFLQAVSCILHIVKGILLQIFKQTGGDHSRSKVHLKICYICSYFHRFWDRDIFRRFIISKLQTVLKSRAGITDNDALVIHCKYFTICYLDIRSGVFRKDHGGDHCKWNRRSHLFTIYGYIFFGSIFIIKTNSKLSIFPSEIFRLYRFSIQCVTDFYIYRKFFCRSTFIMNVLPFVFPGDRSVRGLGEGLISFRIFYVFQS